MLKVEHIFKIQCLKLYYNVINERTPDFFSNMFKLKSRMHSHDTRHKNYIHIAGTRTTSAKQCIRQYIPTVLTSIPTLVSDKITTHAGFSRYAKQYFIQLYKATNGRRGATPRWAISCYEANKEGSVSHTIRITEVWLNKLD